MPLLFLGQHFGRRFSRRQNQQEGEAEAKEKQRQREFLISSSALSTERAQRKSRRVYIDQLLTVNSGNMACSHTPRPSCCGCHAVLAGSSNRATPDVCASLLEAPSVIPANGPTHIVGVKSDEAKLSFSACTPSAATAAQD